MAVSHSIIVTRADLSRARVRWHCHRGVSVLLTSYAVSFCIVLYAVALAFVSVTMAIIVTDTNACASYSR